MVPQSEGSAEGGPAPTPGLCLGLDILGILFSRGWPQAPLYWRKPVGRPLPPSPWTQLSPTSCSSPCAGRASGLGWASKNEAQHVSELQNIISVLPVLNCRKMMCLRKASTG